MIGRDALEADIADFVKRIERAQHEMRCHTALVEIAVELKRLNFQLAKASAGPANG
jgi:hypothetical protein